VRFGRTLLVSYPNRLTKRLFAGGGAFNAPELFVNRCKRQHVADLQIERLRRACRQLEGSAGPSCGCGTPRLDVVRNADDRLVAAEEDDVDREPHEEHLDRAGALDQHAVTGLQAVAAQQSAHAREGALRQLAAVAHDAVVAHGDADGVHLAGSRSTTGADLIVVDE